MDILSEHPLEKVIESFPEAVGEMAMDIADDSDCDDDECVRRYVAEHETRFAMIKVMNFVNLARWDHNDLTTMQYWDEDDHWQPLPDWARK